MEEAAVGVDNYSSLEATFKARKREKIASPFRVLCFTDPHFASSTCQNLQLNRFASGGILQLRERKNLEKAMAKLLKNYPPPKKN